MGEIGRFVEGLCGRGGRQLVGGGDGGEGGDGDDGGAAVRWRRQRRRRWLEDGGVAMTVEMNQWPGQGVAAVVAAVAVVARRCAAAAARRRAAAVRLLPRPSLSSHLRGRALLSFFK